MGGVSTSNNLELCQDAKNVQRKILRVPVLGGIILFYLRTTSKTKALYNKA